MNNTSSPSHDDNTISDSRSVLMLKTARSAREELVSVRQNSAKGSKKGRQPSVDLGMRSKSMARLREKQEKYHKKKPQTFSPQDKTLLTSHSSQD